MRIDKEQTDRLGENFISEAESFKENTKKLNLIIDNINNAWTGEDALAYVNAMREKYIPDLEKLGECLSEYGVYLRNVGTAYEILDETFKSRNIGM